MSINKQKFVALGITSLITLLAGATICDSYASNKISTEKVEIIGKTMTHFNGKTNQLIESHGENFANIEIKDNHQISYENIQYTVYFKVNNYLHSMEVNPQLYKSLNLKDTMCVQEYKTKLLKIIYFQPEQIQLNANSSMIKNRF